MKMDNRLSISSKNSKSPDFQQSLRHISSISYSIHRNVLRKKTLVEKKKISKCIQYIRRSQFTVQIARSYSQMVFTDITLDRTMYMAFPNPR